MGHKSHFFILNRIAAIGSLAYYSIFLCAIAHKRNGAYAPNRKLRRTNGQCRQLSKLRQVKIYLYLIIFI